MTRRARKTTASAIACVLTVLAAITLRDPLASASSAGSTSTSPPAPPGITITIPLVNSLLGGLAAVIGHSSPAASAPRSQGTSTHVARHSAQPSVTVTPAPRVGATRTSRRRATAPAPHADAVVITSPATGHAAPSHTPRHRVAQRIASRRSDPKPAANRDYLLARSPLGDDASWILVGLVAICAAGTAVVVLAGGHRERRERDHHRR